APIFGEPRTIVVTVRFDDERVTVPVSDCISEPVLFGRVFRKFSSVGPDGAPVVAVLEELNDPVGFLEKFKTVVPREQARIAKRITPQHGIFRIGERYSERTIF